VSYQRHGAATFGFYNGGLKGAKLTVRATALFEETGETGMSKMRNRSEIN